jgi:hypothetical protein
MNKSQRIWLDLNNPNSDKHLKVKLEQNTKTLEVLTLSLDTKDFYRSFNADYGVLIGRVIANDGIGIPNAKISVFIPLSEEDQQGTALPEKIRVDIKAPPGGSTFTFAFEIDGQQETIIGGPFIFSSPTNIDLFDKTIESYIRWFNETPRPYNLFIEKYEIIDSETVSLYFTADEEILFIDKETHLNGEIVEWNHIKDTRIRDLYPYTTPRDKNLDGKRYNLLPRVGEYIPEFFSYRPKQPFGSFPTKPEIITNKTFGDVYKKYYKFTTVTNDFGDYMIFGAPVGLHTVHMSVDITDIGKYSMSPAIMVAELGYSSNLFTDNNSKIKSSRDLDDLPNIETQEISVEIAPFWGNKENFEIGITRQDFRIRAQLVNSFTVFGTSFADHYSSYGGSPSDEVSELYHITPLGNNDSLNSLHNIKTKKSTRITERIFFYPNTISDEDINTGNVDDDGDDMQQLFSSQYAAFKKGGAFAYLIPCNRRKIITDEVGNEIVVNNDHPGGIYTQFRGFFIFEYDDNDLEVIQTTWKIKNRPLSTLRTRIKIPQAGNNKGSFAQWLPDPVTAKTNTENWRKQHKVFNGGDFYGVSRFNGVVSRAPLQSGKIFRTSDGFINDDRVNGITNIPNYAAGILESTVFGDDDDIGNETYFPHNTSVGNNLYFGANWLNFCLYFPNINYLNLGVQSDTLNSTKSNSMFTQDFRPTPDGYVGFEDILSTPYIMNTQKIAAGVFDTSRLLRSDLHWSDFVVVTRKDLGILIEKTQNNELKSGFDSTEITPPLESDFRNGIKTFSGAQYNIFNGKTACPHNGGKINMDPSAPTPDPRTYFYKGVGVSDCINFLIELGLV